jgi:hypothetical protein
VDLVAAEHPAHHRISKWPGCRRRGGRHQHGRFRTAILASRRRASSPARRAPRGYALVLSSVPDMLADAVATRVLLMLTHLLTAAIVISTVTRRLS